MSQTTSTLPKPSLWEAFTAPVFLIGVGAATAALDHWWTGRQWQDSFGEVGIPVTMILILIMTGIGFASGLAARGEPLAEGVGPSSYLWWMLGLGVALACASAVSPPGTPLDGFPGLAVSLVCVVASLWRTELRENGIWTGARLLSYSRVKGRTWTGRSALVLSVGGLTIESPAWLYVPQERWAAFEAILDAKCGPRPVAESGEVGS